MGSFSYTCLLSGLPITSGDNAVILPMLPKEKWYDFDHTTLMKRGKSCLVSNDGPNALFDEVMFPIKGVYNDYGSLEDIVEDDNTKCLEKFFNMKIEHIVEMLTNHDDVKSKDINKRFLSRLSVTWFSGDLYEGLTKNARKDSDYDRLDLGTHEILNALGFKLLDEKGSDQRYNKVYEKDGFKVFSDGTWLGAKTDSVYTLKDFKKYCKRNKIDIDIADLDSKNLYEQLYDYTIPSITSLDDIHGRSSEHLLRCLFGNKYNFGLYSRLKEDFDIEYLNSLITDSVIKKNSKEYKLLKGYVDEDMERKIRSVSLTGHYFNEIKANGNNFLRKSFVDWHIFKNYMYPVGRYFIPIGTSPQCGEPKVVKRMLEEALKVVNEKLKNYEEYE